MYFNVAAILMNMAEYLLCWQMTPYNASKLEKESYRFLLQAAGYFSLLQEMAHDVKSYCVGTTELKHSDDLQEEILEFLRLVALAQAQEIGAAKAVESEVSGGKSMVAKLLNQVVQFYKKAIGIAQESITSSKNEFLHILAFSQLKVDVFEALTFSYAASSIFDNNPSEGLWFLSQSDIYARVVVNHRDQARKKKVYTFSWGRSYSELLRRCAEELRAMYKDQFFSSPSKTCRRSTNSSPSLRVSSHEGGQTTCQISSPGNSTSSNAFS
ncbi:putative replication factor A, 51kDa subunit [Trypanosoma cruzi Dm28c]|uniref:Putative replication factor A, 51kDa subunit n=1 Tax=Trypanosoma cruzi Dm28c TaxID=1416333 RepID=V5BH24_TRYCR|nr:putative replication factor A, 51kDa subunit [Trypanosoma cruzi Dm28c]